MESSVEPTRHPLLAGVEDIEAALDHMASAEPLYLSPPEKRALLVDLARLESRLTSVRSGRWRWLTMRRWPRVLATRLLC